MKATLKTTAGAIFDNEFVEEGEEYYSSWDLDGADSGWDVSVKTDLGWTTLS
jgi:hypothetical protein